MANYRMKPLVSSNVYPDVRISGMFAVGATAGALLTIVRPSAGSGASPGVGELFTATQPTTNYYQYLVALTENYFAPVWVEAKLMLCPNATSAGSGYPNAITAATAPSANVLAGGNNVGVFVTAVDVPFNTGATVPTTPGSGIGGSNSFWISLQANNTLLTSGSLTLPSNYTLMIGFEGCFKNSVSPNTL